MAGSQTITAVVAADSRPFKKGMTDAGKSTKTLSTSLTKMGKVGALAFAAMAAGVAVFAVKSLKAAAESEAVARSLSNAATNAKLFGKSTVEINKVTDALTKHSAKLAALTGVDDEYLDKLKTGWLGVPNIVRLGVRGINDLSEIAVNIAAQAGKDSEGVAQALARVFSNPEQAMKRLQKAGVYLSEQQKTAYDKILATNGTIAAQNYLIGELQKKYKGAAEAAANPFERLKVVFENLQETVGAALLPAFIKLVDGITPLIEGLGPVLAGVFGALTPIFDTLKSIMPSVAKAFAKLAAPLKLLFGFVAQLVSRVMPIFVKLFNALLPVVEKLLPPLLDLLDAILTPLLGLVSDIIDALQPLIDAVLPILVDLIKMITPILGVWLKLLFKIVGIVLRLTVAFNPIIQIVLPMLAKAMEKALPWIEKFAAFIDEKLSVALDWLEPRLKMFEDWAKRAKEWLKPLYDWISDVGDKLGVLFGWNNKTLTVSATTTAAPVGHGAASPTGNTTININASSVDTSANTGKAIAKALGNFYSMNGYPGLKGKYNY